MPSAPPQVPYYNTATAAGAAPYPQYGAPPYAQGPILGAPRSPYFGSYAATERRPPGNLPPEFDNQIQHFQDMAAKFDAQNKDLQQAHFLDMATKFQTKDVGVPTGVVPITHPAHPDNRFVPDPRFRGRRRYDGPRSFPAASTSVVYDEDEQMSRGPVDITGIKPTLFNMVSRNQPGALKGQKIGNVR